MQISIIPKDKTIVKNGAALVFEFTAWPKNLHAMQWNGTNGTIEFNEGASQWFDNVAMVQGYIDAYDAEAARIAAELAAAELIAPAV